MVSILSWNIMGRSPQESDFDKIVERIKSINADILCLQEVPLDVKRSDFIKKLRNYYFIRSKDFYNSHDHDADIIFSTYPLHAAGELDFRSIMKDNKHHGHECIWADIKIKKTLFRIYNCHLGIKHIGIRERVDAIKYVLRHANKFKGPIIVCGDMNTTVPKVGFRRFIVQIYHREQKSMMYVDGKYFRPDERYAFLEAIESLGFKELLDIRKTTWAIPHTSIELFNLKLDWFLIKNINNARYELMDYYSSDHRPILVNVR